MAKTISELKAVYGGVTPSSTRTASVRPVIVPLSSSLYTVHLTGHGLLDFITAAEQGPPDVQVYAVQQLGDMAMANEMRGPLLERGAVSAVVGAVQSRGWPNTDEAWKAASSFVSNLCLCTQPKYSESQAHYQCLVPYADDLLLVAGQAAAAKGESSAVAYAIGYFLNSFAQCPALCMHLTNQNTAEKATLLSFLLKTANGRTEARHTVVVKLCIEALWRLVEVGLNCDKTSTTTLFRTFGEPEKQLAKTLSQWALDVSPWQWWGQLGLVQMALPILLQLSAQQQSVVETLQRWIANEMAQNDTSTSPVPASSLYFFVVSIANEIAARPSQDLPTTINNDTLRTNLIGLAPSREAADWALGQLASSVGEKKFQGTKQ